MATAKHDKGVFERQSVTVGGHSVSIEPESLQIFDHKGDFYVKSITPQKKKASPDSKADDLVLHIRLNGQLDLSVEQAKEVIGEYTISALCARAGDIASAIKFRGRIANMHVRLFGDSYDLDAVDFENISIILLRRHGENDQPKHWIVRMSFQFTFKPTVSNAVAVLSEHIHEDIPFECMPMNGEFDFDDQDWQEKVSTPENSAPPAETPLEQAATEREKDTPEGNYQHDAPN